MHNHQAEWIKQFVIDRINSNPLLQVEYFEIVDEDDLLPVMISANLHTVALLSGLAGSDLLIMSVFIRNFSPMFIEIVKSKLHKVTVTEANLQYNGSITIDEDLMDCADLIENEKVQVLNINNGERFDTYVIKGERGSGTICLNGPAARKALVGDVVIIISYAMMDFNEAKSFVPKIIFPDTASNKVINTI